MKYCKSKCGALLLLAIAGIALVSYLVMLLWNHVLMSAMDGVHAIDYCQAVGLLLLSKILFGRWHCGRCKGGHGCGTQAMTSEEEQQARCGLFKRFKCNPPPQD